LVEFIELHQKRNGARKKEETQEVAAEAAETSARKKLLFLSYFDQSTRNINIKSGFIIHVLFGFWNRKAIKIDFIPDWLTRLNWLC